MECNWNNFIKLFLSAGLTSWINWLIFKKNYKNEYYKKILDKRIIAYEAIENFLGLFRITTMALTRKGNQLCHGIFAAGTVGVEKLSSEIDNSMNHSLWVSERINVMIMEFQLFLSTEFFMPLEKIGNHEEKNEFLINLGASKRDEIKKHILTIRNALYQELYELHDVEGFLKIAKKGWKFKGLNFNLPD